MPGLFVTLSVLGFLLMAAMSPRTTILIKAGETWNLHIAILGVRAIDPAYKAGFEAAFTAAMGAIGSLSGGTWGGSSDGNTSTFDIQVHYLVDSTIEVGKPITLDNAVLGAVTLTIISATRAS